MVADLLSLVTRPSQLVGEVEPVLRLGQHLLRLLLTPGRPRVEVVLEVAADIASAWAILAATVRALCGRLITGGIERAVLVADAGARLAGFGASRGAIDTHLRSIAKLEILRFGARR